MPITINTNVSAMIAQRNLGISSNRSASSLAKLSSGTRVPSAKDDAAALAVGTGIKADVAAFRQAGLNAQQGVALLQVADGGFQQISDILIRMKSLASQAQSDQISDTERGFLDTEYQELLNEVNRISATTEFNGNVLLGQAGTVVLNTGSVGANIAVAKGFVGFTFDDALVAALDAFSITYDASEDTMTIANTTDNRSQTLTVAAAPGDGQTAEYNFSSVGVKITLSDDFDDTTDITATNTFAAAAGTGASTLTVNIQVGIGVTTNDQISVGINAGNTTALGIGGTSITSSGNADTASGNIDTAIGNVNTARSEIGAGISRLQFAGNNIAVAVENLSAAQSVLMDVDVSMEITEFTSQQVLIQAGVSMLAQANQQPSLLLRLLQ